MPGMIQKVSGSWSRVRKFSTRLRSGVVNSVDPGGLLPQPAKKTGSAAMMQQQPEQGVRTLDGYSTVTLLARLRG